ncbi:hypothetical protein WR25_25172 [Diploscapter pachys]|uniref:C-type lectin domain-containing protein n=1 Tax=Diploscapter pachys TaxID=2018661 RepID=A0A2A2LVR7_9BILA|nr:hypothetical protein WR25_25172 [Diploscapter pachys]
MILQEIDFARRLGDYISARGPASFAFFLYGCNSQGEANDYPNYVYTYEDMLSMTHNLSDYYDDSCLKNNPLLLPTSTDDVSKANPFYAIDGWPVIAISVGSGVSQFAVLEAATPSLYAFLNATDGLWYESSDSDLMQMLCQLEIPKPPTTTIDPNQEWANPCQGEGNFSHFKELNNSKCYKVSDDMKTFSESMSYCLELAPKMVYKHPPVLTSIETEAEMTQLKC